ncbi:MAG: 5'-nucleotidase, lipoprotein e(P4) family [Candidatus Cloacimonetes bacterium]|nr:5'-nucleotidase, lipoprotein e(P4) family [Candidatus Cloacimonadota bacterium]
MRKIPILLMIVLFITCCVLKENTVQKNRSELNNPYLLMSILWQQTSGEYRALAYQGYNLARERLDEDLKIKRVRKRAIIADIDETVLNNSYYNAKLIIEELDYPDDFYKWIDLAQATPVPGALGFLKYAADCDCEVFYISNRRTRCMDGTLKNLQKFGFPQADEDHVMLKEDISSKESRRTAITEQYDVILLLGDNLIDFSDLFLNNSVEARFSAVDSLESRFGEDFIIFPNPMHGSWIKALLDYQSYQSEEEFLSKVLPRLETF